MKDVIRHWGSRLAFLTLLLALGACREEKAFTVSEQSLTFSSRMGDTSAPGAQQFTIRLRTDDPVYLGILYDDGPDSPIENVSVYGVDEKTGIVGVVTKKPDDLGPGRHTGNVAIIGCVDRQCSREVEDGRRLVVVHHDVEPDMVASPDALLFSRPPELPVPPARQLRIEHVGRPGPAGISWRATFHPESGEDWLRVSPAEGRELPASLQVEVPRALIRPGLYRGTIHFSVFTADGHRFSWMDIPVAYAVEESALKVTPDNPVFVLMPGATSEQLSQTVTVGGEGPVLSWTATSDAPWLQVSPGSGSTASPAQVTLRLVPEEQGRMPRGEYVTTVTFRYGDGSGASKLLPLPVKLHTELPQVDSVAPYIAVAGRSEGVILRGSGFKGLSSPNVRFGGALASTVEVVSDTELRVTPPALPAGRYPVRLEVSPFLASSQASLFVQDVQTYSPASLPAVGFKRRLLHDAERQALYVANETSQTLERFSYDRGTGTWSASGSVAVAELRDVALTLDGKELLALSRTALRGIDPVSLAVRWTYFQPPYASSRDIDRGDRLAVANDGKVIILGDFVYSFDLASHELSTPFTSSFYPGIRSTMAASGDGHLIVVSQGSGSPLLEYNASYSGLYPRNITGESWFVALDRAGTRWVIGTHVLYMPDPFGSGSIPENAGAVLTPDGTRAWTLDWSTGRLRAFDLTGPRSSTGEFPEVPTDLAVGPLSGGYFGVMTLAPDANTLFFADGQHVFVQPLPPP